MLDRLKNLGSNDPQPEVDVAHVVAANTAGPVTLLDVRELDEWQDGHIAGALHIPLGDLAQRVTEIDASLPLITVCRSGRRSLDAVVILNAAGIEGSHSMAGGMLAWQEAGHPVENS